MVLVVVVGVLAAAAVSVLHDGMSARAQPSALEAAVAGVMRKLAMPSPMREAKNPVPSSPGALRDGRMHFADHCAICHGNDGSGDTMMGRGMYPKPPDLRAPMTQNRSDGEIFWIIENGVRLTGMPGFGGATTHGDTSQDTWKLVHFIRHLPALTPEERMEMEKYNPKGPDDREEDQEEQDFLNGAPSKSSPEPVHHHH